MDYLNFVLIYRIIRTLPISLPVPIIMKFSHGMGGVKKLTVTRGGGR